MPTRKEPKEAVIYPASKRKPLPFKPHRPATLGRTSTHKSESSSISRTATTKPDEDGSTDEDVVRSAAKQPNRKSQPARTTPAAVDDIDQSDLDQSTSDSSDDLPDDPLMAKRAPSRRSSTQHTSKPTTSNREPTREIEQELMRETNGADISQALILRLMHEHFKSKETQIDKHALKVVQRYVEVFLRESVARAALSQKDEVDSGVASQSDRGWLDSKDLEKVAGGIILDL